MSITSELDAMGTVIAPEIADAAVRYIKGIDISDPEKAHAEIDRLLRALVPVDVRKACEDIESRCAWWATA